MMFLVLLLLAAFVPDLEAANEYNFAGSLFLLAPAESTNIFTSITVGADLRFKPFEAFGCMVSYAYLGKDYYGINSTSGEWTGPVEWRDVDTSVNESDWLFYHTRHMLGLSLLAFLDWRQFEFYGGLGPMISFVLPSGAAEYYPEFSDYFAEAADNAAVLVGSTVRLGAEYEILTWFRGGLEFMFEEDRIVDFADNLADHGIDYFRYRSNLTIKVTFVVPGVFL